MSIPTAATSSWAFSLPGSIISSRGGGMMMMMKKPYSSGNAIVAAFPLRMSSSSSSSYYRRENQARPLLACHFRKIRRSDGTTPSYDNTSTLQKALADESLMMDLFEEWMQNNDRVYPTQEEKQTRYEKFKRTVKLVYDNNKVWNRSHTLCVSFLADKLPGEWGGSREGRGGDYMSLVEKKGKNKEETMSLEKKGGRKEKTKKKLRAWRRKS